MFSRRDWMYFLSLSRATLNFVLRMSIVAYLVILPIIYASLVLSADFYLESKRSLKSLYINLALALTASTIERSSHAAGGLEHPLVVWWSFILLPIVERSPSKTSCISAAHHFNPTYCARSYCLSMGLGGTSWAPFPLWKWQNAFVLMPSRLYKRIMRCASPRDQLLRPTTDDFPMHCSRHAG